MQAVKKELRQANKDFQKTQLDRATQGATQLAGMRMDAEQLAQEVTKLEGVIQLQETAWPLLRQNPNLTWWEVHASIALRSAEALQAFAVQLFLHLREDLHTIYTMQRTLTQF